MLKKIRRWLKKKKRVEFIKLIVSWALMNGTVWIYLNYWLSARGLETPENLGKVIVAELIGVPVVYCCKALFENLSKNNALPWQNGQGEEGVAENAENNADEEGTGV